MSVDPKALAAKILARMSQSQARPQGRTQARPQAVAKVDPKALAQKIRARMTKQQAIRPQARPQASPQARPQGFPQAARSLPPTGRRAPRSPLGLLRTVDLFSGVGGFTMGVVSAGCPMPLGVERQATAVEVARRHGHRVEQMDVAGFGGMEAPFGIDLLVGGPPCQPFSSAGSRGGRYDPRDGFKLVYNVIDETSPRRVVFENVPDFLLGKHADYAKEVLDNLGKRFPSVGIWKLNAKDFGVPQDRNRVFIWAADRPIAPPVPTYGPRAGRPYRTVRNALPHLEKDGRAILVRNTSAVSRSLDEPSPTVTTRRTMYTATEPGLVYPEPKSKVGRILYPEETKILQGFPEAFMFVGTLDQQQTQIGNAVPPALGEAVVRAMTAGLVLEPMHPSDVLDRLQAENPNALLVEPREIFDRALVGITNFPAASWGKTDPDAPRPLRAVYDYMGMVDAAVQDVLAETPDMDPEEAFVDADQYVDQIDFRSSGPNAPEIIRFDDDDPRWETE